MFHPLRAAVLAFVATGAFAVTAAAATESAQALAGLSDWTTFQGNPAHTGYVPVQLDASSFEKRWQIPVATVQDSLLPGVASIATSNGRVYVSGGTQLKVYSETDGSPVWSHDFSDLAYPSVNPPSVSRGVVYVAAGQQDSTFLFAFDAVSGAPVFKRPMSSQWENFLAPTAGASGIYTNAGTYGGLYGFARTGRQLFFAPQDQQSLWTPAVNDSGVYSYTGVLTVSHPRTGAVLHQIADDTFTNYTYIIGGSPVLGANGHVFAANYANAQLNSGTIGNHLLAFSTATDSVAWKVAGSYPTTPAYAGGRVYAVNNRPARLEVRAEADGALEWTWTPPASGGSEFVSEVLLTQNLAFVSTTDATYAVSLKSHETVWVYPRAGKLALSKSGQLYIQGQNFLTAIKVR